MNENLQKVSAEFIEHISKLDPIQDGDMIIITVKDRYRFDQRDLWQAIVSYNKSHPELRGMNVPFIIIDESTTFQHEKETIYRVFCDGCLMWGSPMNINDQECGNCRSLNTRVFVEIPRKVIPARS